MIPVESRDVFLSNFYKLTADTEVEYREWQRGSPPQNARDAAAGKLNSQVSELTQSFDGSRSGKSRSVRFILSVLYIVCRVTAVHARMKVCKFKTACLLGCCYLLT